MATIVQRARLGFGAVAVEYMNQQQATANPINAQSEILRFMRSPDFLRSQQSYALFTLCR